MGCGEGGRKLIAKAGCMVGIVLRNTIFAKKLPHSEFRLSELPIRTIEADQKQHRCRILMEKGDLKTVGGRDGEGGKTRPGAIEASQIALDISQHGENTRASSWTRRLGVRANGDPVRPHRPGRRLSLRSPLPHPSTKRTEVLLYPLPIDDFFFMDCGFTQPAFLTKHMNNIGAVSP